MLLGIYIYFTHGVLTERQTHRWNALEMYGVHRL